MKGATWSNRKAESVVRFVGKETQTERITRSDKEHTLGMPKLHKKKKTTDRQSNRRMGERMQRGNQRATIGEKNVKKKGERRKRRSGNDSN